MSRQSDAAAESLPGHEDFSSPRGPPVCLRRGPRALTRREARGPPCPQLLGSCCTHRAPRAGSQTMPMPGPAALRGLDTQRPRGPCAPSHPPCPAHGSQQGLREGPARALFSCRQPAAGLSTGLGVLPNPRAADPGPPNTASSMGVSTSGFPATSSEEGAKAHRARARGRGSAGRPPALDVSGGSSARSQRHSAVLRPPDGSPATAPTCLRSRPLPGS